jgi:radical SAM protein with 4Fe4S-binding SPASM domain
LIKKSKILSVPYKFVGQKLIDKKFPHHLFLEATSACNLKCKMCARNTGTVEIGSMDFGLFKKIVDEAAEHGPRNFSLHLFGEPLLSPNIIPMIEYIKKSNQKNNILLTTNGVFLDKEKAEKIISAGVDKIAISVHSANKEKYKEITGVDQLGKVEENIKNLLDIKKKYTDNKTKIYLRMVAPKEDTKEISDFRKKWESYPVIIDIREPHNFGGRIEAKKPKEKRYPCYHLWLSPGINWNGKVSICCQDTFKEEIIGDANNQPISEIWNGEKLKKYRKYHLKGEYGKIPLCKKCNGWSTYPDMFFNWQKK